MTEVDSATLIESGRRVLATEGAAVSAFADALGDSFVQAVECILDCKGRVIVSGMGKSGHVGCKIAATLASTGTPAQFVHPAEASHGDLGMVTRADVVMVLSNSGETPELADIIAHTRRFDIPMIGVASRADSTLLQQSDIAIVLPQAPEACPNGLAPTTSTTLTLALGDALAVALMDHRHFTPDDFRSFHPGGQLGARLATVANLMHGGEALPLVPETMPMPEVLIAISQKGFGVAGVTSADGKLAGIITDGDLRRSMEGLLDRKAGDVMTRGPRTVATTALASEALGIMNEKKITSLFAEDPDRPGYASGILHVHDCLRAGLV
ncbi:KpsF/GutQ family sugar-phosphate isomerase [Oceanomicrobium pacificus]|uniref:KpsF/GutQ family sugar-phosphate isomerase n=1 Tax=Oceanomicrobium pacificus TaxID=2692916 RepID=A0A6B0U0M7_9RHOB|nr:KpsF/GutQ family sugar-phosphate isomerase [Oceanomicrobium pacificus]MXU64681.1 KpsF/GutQ family sugar-phosphate isomerase [Oceanomicrobium pacificus]